MKLRIHNRIIIAKLINLYCILIFTPGFILPDYHYIQQETEIKQLIERYNSEQLLNDRTGKQIKGIDDEFAVNNLLITFEEN